MRFALLTHTLPRPAYRPRPCALCALAACRASAGSERGKMRRAQASSSKSGGATAGADAAAAALVAPLLDLRHASQRCAGRMRHEKSCELAERALATAEKSALPGDSLVLASTLYHAICARTLVKAALAALESPFGQLDGIFAAWHRKSSACCRWRSAALLCMTCAGAPAHCSHSRWRSACTSPTATCRASLLPRAFCLLQKMLFSSGRRCARPPRRRRACAACAAPYVRHWKWTRATTCRFANAQRLH
jgi:hypothetical protein